MNASLIQKTGRTVEKIEDNTVSFLEKTIQNGFHGLEEVLKTLGITHFMVNRLIDGGIIPALQSVLEVEKDVTDGILETLSGNRKWDQFLEDILAKTTAGARYEELVQTHGKELFGSAVYPGEKLLASNDYLKLSYLPSKKGNDFPVLFHVGGFLPYSDGIFRFLPEANFFERFLERGISVYALELKGDITELGNLGDFTLSRFFQMIDEMSDIAFEHNGKKRMMIEGYCGLAMPMLSYLAAMPEKARKKFKTAFTMVAPIDGKKCRNLSQMLTQFPQNFLTLHFSLSELGGYVRGTHLRAGMDIPIKGYFPKTLWGRFVTGWKNQVYSRVSGIEDLDQKQRKDLAGAYWISPQNCDRFPMPVDLVRFSSSLFVEGVDESGEIPYEHKREKLQFKTIFEETDMNLVGFYGGKDNLVPNATGGVLKNIFGSRYEHVVHPRAGHISYVLSPELWQKNNQKGFAPNPIDVVLKMMEQ